MQRSAKVAFVAVIVVIIVGGSGFWWFVLRGDAPERVSLPIRTTEAGSGPTDEVVATDLDGDWTVRSGDDVFVGYRVLELFAGETVKKTAVGRTTAVTGSMTIVDGRVTAVEITADVTELTSDEARRDNMIRRSGLETGRYPEATFTLDEPIDLPEPTTNEEISVTARGRLTLHGQTRAVEIPLRARWGDGLIDVIGTAPVVFSDFGIDPPSNPMITVDDKGEFELQLVFERT